MASILLLVGLVMAFNSSTDAGRQRIEKRGRPPAASLVIWSPAPHPHSPRRGYQILIPNYVRARANQRQPVELLGLLQAGHCSRRTGLVPVLFHFGGQA